MTELARAARERLGSDGPREASVRRISLEIEVDGQVEVVVVSMRAGGLVAVSSDGRTEGPHVDAALALLANMELAAPGRLSEVPAERRTEVPPPPSPHAAVAGALDELTTAIVRAGTLEAMNSPAVQEAFEHVIREAGRPAPLGLSRAIGRLREALADRDPEGVVRILEGAMRLVNVLGEGGRSPEARRCISAWLGHPGRDGGGTSLSDRQLVEIGREWLTGISRNALQRRYLMCTSTGSVYREDHSRGATASVGPCPRALKVGFAELEPGPEPFRIRLLQYEVSPRVDHGTLVRIEELGLRRFVALRDQYRSWSKSFPALAEPFVVLVPERYAAGRALRAFDAADESVILEAEAGTLERFESLRAEFPVRWVAGRVMGMAGNIVLALHSACFDRDDTLTFERLR